MAVAYVTSRISQVQLIDVSPMKHNSVDVDLR